MQTLHIRGNRLESMFEAAKQSEHGADRWHIAIAECFRNVRKQNSLLLSSMFKGPIPGKLYLKVVDQSGNSVVYEECSFYGARLCRVAVPKVVVPMSL